MVIKKPKLPKTLKNLTVFKKHYSFRLFGYGLFAAILLVGCSQKQENKIKPSAEQVAISIEISGPTVDESLLFFDKSVSTWLLNDSLFTGFVSSSFEDGSPKEKFGVYQGKKQHKAQEWFSNGTVKTESNFHKGKLHGEKKVWTEEDGYSLKAHYKYAHGKMHGEQKKWYSTGEVYQILNLEMGREEGIQQAFRKNGKLYANYEAKDGRTYGLKRASLCFGLEDQKIKTNE